MVILDLAIVNVAVRSIGLDLGVDQSDLQWVVVTYGLTLGGFLLLGGRAADLVGRRGVLATGLATFAVASLGAGLAGSFGILVACRALQGLGAAMAAPAALSVVVSTFAEGPDRNRALGIFGGVGATAAAAGTIAGGLLSGGPGWEWIFLVNVPIGIGLAALALRWVPSSSGHAGSVDVVGAVCVTAGLLAVVFALSRSAELGWTASTTIGSAVGGVALLGFFVIVEARAQAPILPLRLLRRRSLVAALLIAALSFGSFIGHNLQLTLFMQQGLGYSPLRTGVSWLATSLPALAVGVFAAPSVVNRVGAAPALVASQLVAAAGLGWLARTPVPASFVTDLLPGLLALGIGIGLAGMAFQAAAFIGSDEDTAGVVGGMVETAREVGGAFGVAIIATAAIAVIDEPSAAGVVGSSDPRDLIDSYRTAALVAAGMALVCAVVAVSMLRPAESRASA